jgi:hypothetical protein
VHSFSEVPANQGILLVRPLLEFSKEDMYNVSTRYIYFSVVE